MVYTGGVGDDDAGTTHIVFVLKLARKSRNKCCMSVKKTIKVRNRYC